MICHYMYESVFMTGEAVNRASSIRKVNWFATECFKMICMEQFNQQSFRNEISEKLCKTSKTLNAFILPF
jgi:hypothetical protein